MSALNSTNGGITFAVAAPGEAVSKTCLLKNRGNPLKNQENPGGFWHTAPPLLSAVIGACSSASVDQIGDAGPRTLLLGGFQWLPRTSTSDINRWLACR